jgi:hypothetical protein
MKIGGVFMMFSSALILIIWAVFIYNAAYVEGQAFERQVGDHLTSISESREERINDFFLEKKNDIEVLAGFQKVKDLLSSDLSSSPLAAKLSVDYRSNIISNEIENYIKTHSKMSLEDLRNSLEFKSIVVQPIGENGYTVLVNRDTFVAEFHNNPDLVGFDYDLVGEEGEEGVSIMREAQESGLDSFGFYNWLDSDGKTREKYAYFSIIPTRTSDGSEFILATTAYIDDYKIIKDVPEDIDSYLRNFEKAHDYHNILLISPDGYITYMARQMGGSGANFGWEEHFKTGLAKSYLNALGSSGAKLFGPFASHYGEMFLKVTITSPVYDGEKLLGFVMLIADMEDVNEISTEATGLWEAGEAYLVNKDALLISPLRYRYLDPLTQSVDTENLDRCVRKFEGGVGLDDDAEDAFYEFLNYRGDLTLGTYAFIPEIEWCLLVEMEKEEILDIPRRNQLRNNIFAFSIIALFSMVLSFYVGNFLNNNYAIKGEIKFLRKR